MTLDRVVREAERRGLIALYNPQGNPYHGEHGYFSGPDYGPALGSTDRRLADEKARDAVPHKPEPGDHLRSRRQAAQEEMHRVATGEHKFVVGGSLTDIGARQYLDDYGDHEDGRGYGIPTWVEDSMIRNAEAHGIHHAVPKQGDPIHGENGPRYDGPNYPHPNWQIVDDKYGFPHRAS